MKKILPIIFLLNVSLCSYANPVENQNKWEPGLLFPLFDPYVLGGISEFTSVLLVGQIVPGLLRGIGGSMPSPAAEIFKASSAAWHVSNMVSVLLLNAENPLQEYFPQTHLARFVQEHTNPESLFTGKMSDAEYQEFQKGRRDYSQIYRITNAIFSGFTLWKNLRAYIVDSRVDSTALVPFVPEKHALVVPLASLPVAQSLDEMAAAISGLGAPFTDKVGTQQEGRRICLVRVSPGSSPGYFSVAQKIVRMLADQGYIYVTTNPQECENTPFFAELIKRSAHELVHVVGDLRGAREAMEVSGPDMSQKIHVIYVGPTLFENVIQGQDALNKHGMTSLTTRYLTVNNAKECVIVAQNERSSILYFLRPHPTMESNALTKIEQDFRKVLPKAITAKQSLVETLKILRENYSTVWSIRATKPEAVTLTDDQVAFFKNDPEAEISETPKAYALNVTIRALPGAETLKANDILGQIKWGTGINLQETVHFNFEAPDNSKLSIDTGLSVDAVGDEGKKPVVEIVSQDPEEVTLRITFYPGNMQVE